MDFYITFYPNWDVLKLKWRSLNLDICFDSIHVYNYVLLLRFFIVSHITWFRVLIHSLGLMRKTLIFGEEIATIRSEHISQNKTQKEAKNLIKIMVDMLLIKVTTGFDYFSSIQKKIRNRKTQLVLQWNFQSRSIVAGVEHSTIRTRTKVLTTRLPRRFWV